MMWFSQPGGFGYGMMGGFGILMMILVIVIVVAVIAVLVRHPSGNRWERQERGRTALDILDERYTRGDIDADEYKKWRADLEL